jgi:hypothetical protein
MYTSVAIPVLSEKVPRWEAKIDLSGRRYGFYISYNTRAEAWFLTMLDAYGKPLLAGIRLVPGVFFLDKYRASVPGLPPGKLWIRDMEHRPNTAEVTRKNLHARFALTYTVEE